MPLVDSRSIIMAQGENSLSHPASRRSFIKGLGAAGAGLTALPRWSFAEEPAAAYANAAIDWKQFAGQTIALSGAIHPWSNAITPLLWDFTKLTGISVVTDFRLETNYLRSEEHTSELQSHLNLVCRL